MERPHIHLTIRRKGENNLVVIDAGGPMLSESEIRIEEKLLRGLVAQVARLTTPREQPGDRGGEPIPSDTNMTVRRLQAIGEQTFRLLPEQARAQLRNAAPTSLLLHTDEQLIHVPWELCHDGSDFLAAKFQMGRYVHIPRLIPLPTREPVEPGLLKVLLIADPTESLPQAAQEAEQLCRVLDGEAKVKVTLLGGKLVNKTELLTALQGHDVVHFAGHSHYDPIHPNQSGWHLHEGILTAEELRTLSRPPLLVFSNSCQAGATMAWGGRYQYEGEAFGIGSAFLAAGVWNYIGTFWVVHDEESRDFAIAFYQGLASGLSLGEALRKARIALRDQTGSERLTWASYMLYGDPAVTFFPAGEVKFIPSSTEAVERKLVAILSADVKGYSRLMGEDDVATVQTLTAHRKVMTALIQKHKGNVVDSPGDNLLALFPSVVGAVQCAVEIQKELKEKNAELPDHRKMEFRIGINIGDIIIGKEGVHGSGVNIAARLEGLAEAGGICISGVVYEQVKSRLALYYEPMGEQRLKNITDPVTAYRVRLEAGVSPPHDRRDGEERPFFLLRQWRRTASLSLLVLLGGIALIVLVVSILPSSNYEDPCRTPKGSKTKAIIIRAFDMLKVDPEHVWLKEAIPRRLSSELSRAEGLKVYPSEHFDWLLQQCRLSDIELARRLGIFKVIRGSFAAMGTTLHIELHPEDVEHPTLEPPEEREGKPDDFFRLIQELTTQIITRLELKSPEPTERRVPNPNTFRLMLEGEGEIPATSPQQKTPSSPDSQSKEGEPQAKGPLSLRWLGVSVAWADEAPPQSRAPDDEIRQALEKYRQAYEKRDLVMLEDVYEMFTIAQRQANTEYFQNTKDLRVTIRDVDISVSENKAAVSYTREDEFLDAKTGQKVKLDARFTKIFIRTDCGWRISMGKK